MLRSLTIQIDHHHELYDYCNELCHNATNIYNATLFRVRQVLTAVTKEPDKLTDNESTVMTEVKDFVNHNKSGRYHMPTKGNSYLNYNFLEALMRHTNNPDFFKDGYPHQCAQNQIKLVTKNMKSFYKAIADYKQNPDKYFARPKLPGYHHKGGCSTEIITNQDAVLYGNMLKLPCTKTRLNIGKEIPGKLKQVTIKPQNGIFIVALNYDDGQETPEPSTNPKRIISIDVGLRNIAAITNNINEPSMLFKGGVLKSVNQKYNKTVAKIVSEQTLKTKQKFKPTPEFEKVCRYRNNCIDDFMHKLSRKIVDWCVEHTIDTIIIGKTPNQKQEIDLGHVTNQNFVQIPFNRLIALISCKATYKGIAVIQHEESYTSKASFIDNDPIPVFNPKEPGKDYKFSGKRSPGRYKNMRSNKGFYGIYVTADGTAINADFNGSANIARKAVPDIFSACAPSFDNVVISKHPDYSAAVENTKKQLALNKHHTSKSWMKREALRQKKLSKVIPME